MNFSYKKMIALLLVLLLLASSLVGCKKPDATTALPEESLSPIAIETVPPETTAAPEAAPTPTLDPDAGAHFASLDLEVFRWYATNDGYSFHQMVSNPADYGIDRSSVTMTLGEFTEADSKVYAGEAAAFLERLNAIPRAALTETEQLSYDVLQQYLEMAADDTDYEYYYEPLTEYSGIHSEIPLMFALFNIETKQDVEDYLALFADVPRYLGQVLAYEQERAKRDLFMTESALDAILSGCKTIIASKKNSFLHATFSEAVDGVDGLTDAEKKAYCERNDSLIKNEFIGAYETLYDGLKDLKKYCRDEVGVYAQGDKGLAYFELCMQQEGNNALTVEETLDLLKNELYYILSQSIEIMQENPDVSGMKGKITSGNTDTDLAQLKEITASVLPALPEHSLTIESVPEELESLLSPACYVIPSLDDWKDNHVLINTAKEDSTMLLTLAHESYPGHLYQYVYQRGLTRLGVMQRALHYGGYAEGWSQLAEWLVTENQTQYDKGYCKLLFCDNMAGNAVLPAIISILVNYYAYSEDSVKAFLSGLGLPEEYAKSYFALAIEQPYYTLCYATGYSQLMQMLRDAETDLGEDFDQKEYLKAYLDLGPGYFNLLQERMDVWVDVKMTEDEV